MAWYKALSSSAPPPSPPGGDKDWQRLTKAGIGCHRLSIAGRAKKAKRADKSWLRLTMADRGKDWQGLTEMDDEGSPGSVSPWHPLSSFRPLKIFDSKALTEFVYSCQPLSALVSHVWSLSILTTLCQFLQDLVSPRQPWSEILSSGEPLLSSVISGHQILVSGSTFPLQSLKSWISSSNLW